MNLVVKNGSKMRERVSALFSYDSLPGQCATDETNAFIYGPRVAAILAARRGAKA